MGLGNMMVNGRIVARRRELGLGKLETARICQLSIQEYDDIESYDDAVTGVALLAQVKKVCAVLKLDLDELFELRCAFCKEGKSFAHEYRLPRGELIRQRRAVKKWTARQLADRVGFHETEINNLETDVERIESWVIDDIRQLAVELEVPAQILLGITCRECGR